MKLRGLWRPERQLFQIYVLVARVGLCYGFCDFAVSFWAPPDGPQKWDRESAFLLFFYLSCACGGKRDRV